MEDLSTVGSTVKSKPNFSQLPTLERETTLSQRVYDTLRDAILNGALPPGQRLVESALASMIHTSKTPVREALLQLEREGLVSMRPGVGVYVAKLSMKQLRDVDHVRRLLEVSALKLAIPTLQPNEIENAEGCLRDMRRLAERRDWEAYWQAHLAFHTILFAASGNQVLTEILLSLLRTTTRYSRICLEASPPLWLYDEQNHELIMQAIKQADLDGIQRIVGEMNDWLLAQFQTATENPEGDLAPYFE